MEMLRISARWTGWPGAPGYSNFYFSNDAGFFDGGLLGDATQVAAQNAADRTSEAFYFLESVLPSGVSIDVEPEAELLDSDTGEVLGALEVDPGNSADGASSGGWSAASGAVINWRTNDYRFGRRIRGRTFMVPLDGGSYQSDGTLSTAARSTVGGFGTRMRSTEGAERLGVWSRPRDGSGGVFATVTGSSVPDMAAVLRSRRD